MSEQCNEFQEACENHLNELFGKAPGNDVARASMQLMDTAGKFTRFAAGNIAIKALSHAEGTTCAQCPVLRSVITDCYHLIEQTQPETGLPN